MTTQTTKANTGYITSVHGSVVDVCFPESLPHIDMLLKTASAHEVAIEVWSQIDVFHIRGMALTPCRERRTTSMRFLKTSE